MPERMDKSVSIVIPYYDKMKGAKFFLNQLLSSIYSQSYTNYEIVITEEGNASHNTNVAIRKAKGDLIKVMFMDDYFTHEHSLRDCVHALGGQKWLIAGSNNNQTPILTGDIHLGNNKLGSPSALLMQNGLSMYFDEKLKWLLDCDFYKQMWVKHGEPVILNGNIVTIGEGDHQATNLLSNKEKDHEVMLMRERYV